MRPFSLPSSACTVREAYPSADSLKQLLPVLPQEQLAGFARQWLTEGVPHLFRDCPLLYQAARSWLAERLGVQPNELTLIGSARIGYSLAPGPDFGRPFGSQSDLDLSVISGGLFQALSNEFNDWLQRFRSGVAVPRNAREARFWDSNVQTVPDNLEAGFIDAHKVPRFDRFPRAQALGQSLWMFGEKLRLSLGTEARHRVSLRIYRGWREFNSRLVVNLRFVVRSVTEAREDSRGRPTTR